MRHTEMISAFTVIYPGCSTSSRSQKHRPSPNLHENNQWSWGHGGSRYTRKMATLIHRTVYDTVLGKSFNTELDLPSLPKLDPMHY